MNDPHILLRITLFAASKSAREAGELNMRECVQVDRRFFSADSSVHRAFLAHRPYAALCSNLIVQDKLMAAHTSCIDVRGREWELPNGKLHSPSPNIPAYCGALGKYKEWYRNGIMHREMDLPAIEWNSGKYKEWHINGQLHREGDLPAVVGYDGCKAWFKFGLRHREGDLPAIVQESVSESWWVNGRRHRENGLPAVIESSGLKEWWVDGVLVRKEV